LSFASKRISNAFKKAPSGAFFTFEFPQRPEMKKIFQFIKIFFTQEMSQKLLADKLLSA
jgi:hypothetical protein